MKQSREILYTVLFFITELTYKKSINVGVNCIAFIHFTVKNKTTYVMYMYTCMSPNQIVLLALIYYSIFFINFIMYFQQSSDKK